MWNKEQYEIKKSQTGFETITVAHVLREDALGKCD